MGAEGRVAENITQDKASDFPSGLSSAQLWGFF